MGVSKYVNFNTYPKQGGYITRRVTVCFNYDTSLTISGTIIRDDMGEPYHTIIKLDDERIVLGTECQYSLIGQNKNE